MERTVKGEETLKGRSERDMAREKRVRKADME